MKISVVIPTYNCARYLPLAIDSVLAQTSPANEILVVDDGSVDDTPEIIARDYGSRVRYIRQSNAGPSAARNRGIREASGDVIAFLDADDLWFPHTLASVREAFRAFPETGLVTADKQVINTEGAVTHHSWWLRQGEAEYLCGFHGKPAEGIFAHLLQTNFVNTSVAFTPRRALNSSGLFDEEIRFGEDWDLWLRIASRNPVICLPEVLGQYRVHDGNVTHATEAMLKDLVRVNRKLAMWAGKQMRKAGVNPRRRIAEALCNLGYWYFSKRRYGLARRALVESLAFWPTKRASKYGLYCCLPAPLVTRLQDLRSTSVEPTPSPLPNANVRSSK